MFYQIKEKTRLKYAVDSLTEHHRDWMTYLHSSLTTFDYNENKMQFFPNAMPFNIHKRMSPIQLLLVVKHFRPDSFIRFTAFFIRKTFKNVILNVPSTSSSIDDHLNQKNITNPTILFVNHSYQSSIYEMLEIKAARYPPLLNSFFS